MSAHSHDIETTVSRKFDITLTINGAEHFVAVEPRATLADAIRDDCGQTGTHIGCEHGVCGACTVLVDGEPVRSCLMFAVQARRQAHPHRRGAGAGRRRAASAAAGLHRAPRPAMRLLHAGLPDAGAPACWSASRTSSDEELLDVLSSNLCRCTGYENIVKAVRAGRCRNAIATRGHG